MTKVTTSSQDDDKATSTPEEQQAAKEYKKQLESEIANDMGDEEDASKSSDDEPTEESDSTTDTEQEQSEEETPEELSPKEIRYKQQLEGERKANRELLGRLEALETLIKTKETKEPDDPEIDEEKRILKERYGLITRDEHEALEKKFQTLVDQRLSPIVKQNEDKMLQSLYKKFPEVSPDKDPSDDKWIKVKSYAMRIAPENPNDPLSDFEDRFSVAYEHIIGKKAVSPAQMKTVSYTGMGGGSSGAKTVTTESDDKYSHLSPAARAYKESIENSMKEDLKREEKLSTR